MTTSTTTALSALFVGSDEILGGRAKKEGCEFSAFVFVFVVLRCWVPKASEQRVASKSNNGNVIVKGNGLVILVVLCALALVASHLLVGTCCQCSVNQAAT